MAFSLNSLRWLRVILLEVHRRRLVARGVEVDPRASVSLSSRMVTRMPGGIRIAADTLVAFKTLLYTCDESTGEERPIRIGERCFIGGGAVIGPGVTIGQACVVGAGAIVMTDMPAGSIIGGSPARVLAPANVVQRFGRLAGADENEVRTRSTKPRQY